MLSDATAALVRAEIERRLDAGGDAPWVTKIRELLRTNSDFSWVGEAHRILDEDLSKIRAENEELKTSKCALEQELENEPLSDAETHLYCSSSESESEDEA
jgi:hypothetical protein